MVVSMKGTPLANAAPWSNEPLERFNRFSNSPISAWTVNDGTLGTFMGQTVVDDKFSNSLRGLGEHGVQSPNNPLNHPSWKAGVEARAPLFRQPKGMRQGISGMELGPTFNQ